MGWLHTRSAGLVPFPCPLSLSPGFYPTACLESAGVFLLLGPVMVCWAPGKEQHWGLCCGLLLVVLELEETGGQRAWACTLGSGRSEELKSRGEHSATSCRAQGAQGHHSGPVGDRPAPLCQVQSRHPSDGQGDDPCPMGPALTAPTLPKARSNGPASSRPP